MNGKVHEIRDAFWGGMRQRGASWLRKEYMGDVEAGDYGGLCRSLISCSNQEI